MNITNVQVSCAAAYTVGGTVSGLSSVVQESLILQDNGGGNFVISANGTFTFGTPVAIGGTYNVTVYAQPANRICTVSGGSGTANQNITSVQVTCVSNELVLHSFLNTPDGSFPAANLVFDSEGNLYGTTAQGGVYGYGTVFKLTLNQGQWTESVIYSFCQQTPNCQDGASPYSGLVFDTQGNLYGTTLNGGAYGGYGVVFELTPGQNGIWIETVLHSFGNGNDGMGPRGTLIFDKAGNLYGTTRGGGTGAGSGNCTDGGCGTAFELSPGLNGQWTETVLYDFCSQTNCPDGENPQGQLAFDPAGNLYGTTLNGGTVYPYNNGTVFELTPGKNGQWTETVLYSFQGSSTDGSNPFAGVVVDKSGNLYGTTELGDETPGGASSNNGTVFELVHGQSGEWTETILHIFCSDVVTCSDGSGPVAGLVFDGAGNLYGTTLNGGTPAYGNVFELTPGKNGNGNWTAISLYQFEGGATGLSPESGVILDANGNVYGAVTGGGSNDNGLVFEIVH
jgi:uncharacterized repeat protein (TIGR03803 family)